MVCFGPGPAAEPSWRRPAIAARAVATRRRPAAHAPRRAGGGGAGAAGAGDRRRAVAPSAAPAPAPAAAISERVRDAARAAGEAARAPAGEPRRRAAGRRGRRRWRRRATGGPDDLKQIKGVGPKLEELLHSLGIYPLRPDRRLGAGGDRLDGLEPRGLHRAGDPRRLGRAGEDPGRGRRDRASRSGSTRAKSTERPGGAGRDDGMLADKDRIFTNLYGMFDRSLAGARARGHWDGTAEIIAPGARQDRRGDEGERAARPRRGGVPDRAEVVVHAEGVGRAAALSGCER